MPRTQQAFDPETVIPSHMAPSTLPAMSRTGGGVGGGGAVNVNVTVSGDIIAEGDLAERIAAEIDRMRSRGYT